MRYVSAGRTFATKDACVSRWLILLLLAAMQPSASGLDPAVYACELDGRPLFTDHGCAEGRQVDVRPQTTTFTPLSEAELARLSAQRERLLSQAKSRAQQRAREQAQAQREASEAASRCAQTLAALRQLRAKRREGYTLKSAPALAEQESRLRMERRQHCR